ncbi:MAG TPA: SUMF1/EgtB/PvdO family nonheme iron enzyme [Solirubrobacteraceae bacterium]|jgi:iron(II)-dependent oxidoreductase|nr:SUMF1/EgtB/PvdO family nonheme iron enzyme [Solirubrobacteraceae bacterium]
MAARALENTPLPPRAAPALIALGDARERTLALVAGLDDEQLERVHSPIMSPLVWDLGHIAAYEDLWLAHRHGGLELLRPELAHLYDAFETPRAVRGEIEALHPAQARTYMAEVSERTAEVIAACGVGDGVLCEMVLRHELQHGETMRQTMAIAGLLPPVEQARADAPLTGEDLPAGWLEIPAGTFAMGAAPDGFAYDNERPRHVVELPAYAIARRPVSNASWMTFSEGGGYERREWWSREGWAWKEEHDITHHRAVAQGHPEAPVCHVSWFEADAFARAHGARLPTEAEWERAATWTQQAPEQRLAGIGRVWEWTRSHFVGYPGFVPYPYREYSQVFFGEDYRVLRGGSWASHPRVATPTFRNWDLPQRRQIFAGVRLSREV